MGSDCFWLTDDQFARLEPHLPTKTRGVPRVDDRRVISGIVHVLRSGGRWADAPRRMLQKSALQAATPEPFSRKCYCVPTRDLRGESETCKTREVECA